MEGKENLGFSSNNPTFLVVPDLQRQNTYVYDADRSLSGMTVSGFFSLKKSNFCPNIQFGQNFTLRRI